jgi:hypothetical protein
MFVEIIPPEKSARFRSGERAGQSISNLREECIQGDVLMYCGSNCVVLLLKSPFFSVFHPKT